jgi:hypothetical protein
MEEKQTGPGAGNKPVVYAEPHKGNHPLYHHIHFPDRLMLLRRSEGSEFENVGFLHLTPIKERKVRK